MMDNQNFMALKNMILINEVEVLCEDIVDESKEPTVPDVYVDKDEIDMNEDYMAD